MKRFLFLSLYALGALLIASCSGDGERVDDASTAAPYPLQTCIVSDEPLGSMGDPVVIVHEGKEIKFCCDSCQPKFEAEPAKYLPKLDHTGHNH